MCFSVAGAVPCGWDKRKQIHYNLLTDYKDDGVAGGIIETEASYLSDKASDETLGNTNKRVVLMVMVAAVLVEHVVPDDLSWPQHTDNGALPLKGGVEALPVQDHPPGDCLRRVDEGLRPEDLPPRGAGHRSARTRGDHQG